MLGVCTSGSYLIPATSSVLVRLVLAGFVTSIGSAYTQDMPQEVRHLQAPGSVCRMWRRGGLGSKNQLAHSRRLTSNFFQRLMASFPPSAAQRWSLLSLQLFSTAGLAF
jgi:hypothetical protein